MREAPGTPRGAFLVVVDMAGDWIKVRLDLPRDPSVVRLANTLQLPDTTIIGALVKMWSWWSEQTENGHADVTLMSWIDEYVGVNGWCEALKQVGWLASEKGDLIVPNFERHLSKSAKERALASVRKARSRSRVSHDSNVTKTGLEKRREDDEEDARAREGRRKSKPSVSTSGRSPQEEHDRTEAIVLLRRHSGVALVDNAGLTWEPGPVGPGGGGIYGPRGFQLWDSVPTVTLRELAQEARKFEARERGRKP